MFVVRRMVYQLLFQSVFSAETLHISVIRQTVGVFFFMSRSPAVGWRCTCHDRLYGRLHDRDTDQADNFFGLCKKTIQSA